jgi:acetolactate synthase I/II/III large subunit
VAKSKIKKSKKTTTMKNGAQILCEELMALGVKTVFGYPGGALLPIYDVINKTGMDVVLNGDERCAGHAAEGYARASGKPGVLLATSGPGGTNIVTPLADAKMDSVPLLAITGQVYSGLMGKDAFQESPIQNVTMQISKHNYLVSSSKDIARVVREAHHIATTGRPGPVHIDITKDAQEGFQSEKEINRDYKLPGYNPHPPKVDLKKLDELADLINKSKRPIIYMGQGVTLGNACGALKAFVKKTKIPVATTLLGKGGFPASHPLFLGMLGMHGTAYANLAIDEADAVLALGARFDDRVTGKVSEFVKNAVVAHVDIDASELNKNKAVRLAIQAEVGEVLLKLTSRIKTPDHGVWLKRIAELKAKYPLEYEEDPKGRIMPQYVLQQLSRLCRDRRTIFTTGVGQHQMWAAQYLDVDDPRTFLSSGGAGTMGFGLPAAVGAQLARPDSRVINIDGDGSFEMNINELRTIADRNIPVKTVILNNRILGMVGQWQRQFYKGNYSSVEFAEYPCYSKGIKDMYGIETAVIKHKKEVIPALEKMLKHKGPYVLDVMTPKEENVLPFIPAGKTVKAIMLPKGQKLV